MLLLLQPTPTIATVTPVEEEQEIKLKNHHRDNYCSFHYCGTENKIHDMCVYFSLVACSMMV